MHGALLYGDVRVGDRDLPAIFEPTDAMLKLAASCICGSDLWPYRGLEPMQNAPMPMGHEYAGVVTAVGAEVTTVKVGDFVVGSFFASDNACVVCRAGYRTHCIHRQPIGTIETGFEHISVLETGTATVELVPLKQPPTLTRRLPRRPAHEDRRIV